MRKINKCNIMIIVKFFRRSRNYNKIYYNIIINLFGIARVTILAFKKTKKKKKLLNKK